MAFSWNGEGQDSDDIYLKQIQTGSLARLTHDAARDFSPVWSPDGAYIAFLRENSRERAALFLISPLGRLERFLAEVNTFRPCWGRQLAWTVDSQAIITVDRESGSSAGLFRIAIENSQRQQLTAPPTGVLGDHSPAVSPDGSKLSFVRSLGERISELFLLPLTGDGSAAGEPQQLTRDGRFASDTRPGGSWQ